jgi:endoglucanase
MVNRRYFVALIGVCLMGLWSCQQRPPTAFQLSWNSYVERFYQNGRIVDTGNDNISHTEGQGYGMLFAVQADDQTRFDAMWRWTQDVMQRNDHLLSWQYTPCASEDKQCITDNNNASDGEILIIWALLRAGEKWHVKEYIQAADQLLAVTKDKLIVERFGETLILPGEYGFDKPDSLQVNLSYWVFPAFAHFYQHTSDPIWNKLIASGLSLMESARFGSAQLNPDWTIIYADHMSLDGAVSADYGFNACRIPLHLVWMNPNQNALLEPYLELWSQTFIPATVNLLDNSTSEYSYTQGMQSIHQLVQGLSDQQVGFSTMEFDEHTDYFSASLILLSSLAWLDQHQ